MGHHVHIVVKVSMINNFYPFWTYPFWTYPFWTYPFRTYPFWTYPFRTYQFGTYLFGTYSFIFDNVFNVIIVQQGYKGNKPTYICSQCNKGKRSDAFADFKQENRVCKVCEKGTPSAINKNKLSVNNLNKLPQQSTTEAVDSMLLGPDDSISCIGNKRVFSQGEQPNNSFATISHSSKRPKVNNDFVETIQQQQQCPQVEDELMYEDYADTVEVAPQ